METTTSPSRNSLGFSQRHPFLFGLILLSAVVALLFGAMTALRYAILRDKPGLLGGSYFGKVHVTGFIDDSAAVVDFLEELREDKKAKGVLLRVDSPGGAVVPAQEMYQAVLRVAAEKPVVVSMGSLAASGGYYLSAAADQIFANPGTITASIGVIMELTNAEGLMDKLGLSFINMTSGELKDAGSPFKPLSEKERQYFQAMVDDLHEQFVSDVAAGREMDIDAVRAIADGRAMTGRQALAVGLVDALGGEEDALSELKALCKVKEDLPFREGPVEKRGLFQDILESTLGFDPASLGARERLTPRFLYALPSAF